MFGIRMLNAYRRRRLSINADVFSALEVGFLRLFKMQISKAARIDSTIQTRSTFEAWNIDWKKLISRKIWGRIFDFSSVESANLKYPSTFSPSTLLSIQKRRKYLPNILAHYFPLVSTLSRCLLLLFTKMAEPKHFESFPWHSISKLYCPWLFSTMWDKVRNTVYTM